MSHLPAKPTIFKVIIQSLLHDKWMTLAIILGVMIGTASLTGALVIGDSVRGSLREMTLLRLGNVDSAVVAPRFFREELAREIQQAISSQTEFGESEFLENVQILPALTLQGSMFKGQQGGLARVNHVQVYGVGQEFLRTTNSGKKSDLSAQKTDNEVILTRGLAEELRVKVGEQISILLEIPSAIPRDTLLGEREEITQEILVKVGEVLDDDAHLARFSLTPNQRLPYNAFVDLSYLQEQLKLQEVLASRRNPVAKPARVNSLYLINHKPEEQRTTENYRELLERKLRECLSLDDLDLRLVVHAQQGYVSLESSRLLLEDHYVRGLELVSKASDMKLKWDVVYVYLMNEYVSGKDENKFSMYSVMGGLDFPVSRTSLPLVDVEGKAIQQVKDGEVLLSDWLAEDLGVKVGEEIICKYHLIGSKGELPEELVKFKVGQIYKLEGSGFADKGFVPELEGFTDVETLQDLDQPFPMKLERVTDRDDAYWEEYRAVPKAYVSLDKARGLWQSRYGKQTSVQLVIPEGFTGDDFAKRIGVELLKQIDLQEAGLIVQSVRKNGLEAAKGSNDFSGLFLGFSLFLISGALLLVTLLYRLSIEQRANQVGLMQAIGVRPRQILFLWGGEGLVTVVLGAVFGTLLAIFYAKLMVYALTTWWLGAVGTTDLGVHLIPTTLVSGFLISTLLSFLVILFSLRGLNTFSPRELLHGDWREVESGEKASWFYRRRYMILVCSLELIGGSLVGIVPRSEAVAGLPWTVFSFFMSGMGLLTAGILISQDLLEHGVLNMLKHQGLAGLIAIAARNTTRQMSRSLVSIALVSIATYLVMAVALGKYNPTRMEPEFKSGNGGFRVLAESTQPVLPDWSGKQGQLDLGMTFNEAEQKLITRTKTYRLLKKSGEDASCLNLYQTSLPTVLGVSKSFIERGGFAFAQTPGKNPWETLSQESANEEIPVLGDMNTLQFSLHKGPGSTIELTNSTLPQAKAKVVGMLTGSVFQGVLLMSEENFRKLYPEVSGASYFLTEVSAEDSQGFTSLLETKLADYGLDVQSVAERQREFLSVQNTYLSTFQSLGGFGLLLGTIGVAIVMLRNVLERKKEYALMRSMGFLPGYLSSLILCENGIIIGYGLSVGTLAAIISMWPHLSQSGADVPWRDIVMLLGLIYSTGILSGLYAAKVASEGSIVETLRN